ncbi:MAG: MFS transporter [Acidimicrobiia bacterium]
MHPDVNAATEEIGPPSARRRLTMVLFSGVALGSTAYIAAVTISTLAVDEIIGSATFAGVPAAVATGGTAAGTTLLTLGVARRGRRPGLMAGYTAAALGSVVGGVSLFTRSLPLLLVGMALLGLGNASSHLARYTAADLYPSDRRGSALGMVVWGGTIGSVLGPALLQPSGRIALDLGRSELLGGFLVSGVFMTAALVLYLIALRPDPASLAIGSHDRSEGSGGIGTAFRLPQVRVALSAMIAGQVVMVMIMTSTPLHIHHHGSDLGIVGLVMSAHTLGMFALSPLTGRLADRFGGYRVVTGGMVLLALAALGAAYGPNSSTTLLVLVLFLLGVGWNMSFVAGSSLLTVGVADAIRSRLQGRVDSLAWISGGLASISSGVAYQATDYRTIALIGLFLLAVPAAVVILHRRVALTI